MKKKLTFLMFSLLLAVGWTSTASAQSPTKQAAPGAKVHSSVSKTGIKGAKVPFKSKAIMDLLVQPVVDNTRTGEYWKSEDSAPAEETPGTMLRAPRRATHTADFTAERSWYEQFEYQWEDANGDTQTSKITEPAVNGHQMAGLVKYIYQTPEIPGILYSDAKGADHEYPNIEFGYDIAPRGNSTTYGDIYIDFPTSYVEFSQIQVYVGDNTTPATEWYVNGYGQSLPTGWSKSGNWGQRSNGYYVLYNSSDADRGGYIRISNSLFAGQSGEVKVYVRARKYSSYNADAYVQVNHQYQQVNTTVDWYDWTVLPNSTGSITKPSLNGYTAFIVKVKDQTSSRIYLDEFTHSWSDITTYFDNYMDAIELLTDGVRIGGTTSNAGTVFSYTGSLNRFFFITKGKMAYLSSLESSASADRAPFYSMYEEFAPTTQTDTAGIKDFYERMDQGEAYGVVHDCQSVNYMEHFFSMTGKGGTTHNTMSNLLFYIPDDRGQQASGSAWRNYDHQPRVGLYTAEIEATAKPNKTQEHVYDVYINWSTSLQTILGFDEPETHDLWVVVKDDNGNVVLDSLLTTSPDTTYTYQVPQYPEGYTIDYIIRAWPTTAPYPVDHDANSTGTFYADSDPAQVLIPGYNDFISLVRRHYESDFDLNTEHNYYRNFMTLSNQNESGLTAADLSNGSKTLKLMRYDLADPNIQTPAANVTFTLNGNNVDWSVNYLNQDIYTGHNPSNKYQVLTQGNNPVYPTSGSFAVGSSGGGNTTGQLTGWSYASAGNYSVPTNWSATSNNNGTVSSFSSNTDNSMYLSGGGTITIPASLLNGNSTVDVVINAARYDNTYTPTVAVNGDSKTLSSTTFSDFTWSGVSATNGITITLSNGYASVMSIQVNGITGSGSTTAYDTTYVLVDSINFVKDCTTSVGNFTVNHGNWSSPSSSMYMTSNGAAYIRCAGTTSGTAWTLYLQYNVPSSLANEKLLFDFGVIDNSTYGSYLACEVNSSDALDDIVQCSSTYRYYSLEAGTLGSGGNVKFYGISPSTTTSGKWINANSPTIYNIYVFKEVVTEVAANSALLDMSGITLVDQFSASTEFNTHPENYGYQLKAAWDDQKTSNVMEVPVQKTYSTLNGFYTFDQMIHDSVPESEWLPINVRNGDLSVPLRGDAEIFFNTIGRKSTADWSRMSYMQFDNNHTFYTEGINYLPQYFGQVAYPGDVIERLDNATVEQGGYNTFNSYVPVVWTYGYRPVNKRHYFDSDSIHNSYGSPIWNTGVGQVTINGLEVQRQVDEHGNDNPSTTWTDGDNNTCNIFFVGIDADGLLPTTNMKGEDGSNYYEPYLFRVWAKSKNGHALRGFTPVTTEHGDKVVDDPTADRDLQVIYEEYTNETKLNKPIPAPQDYVNARNIIKFGALNNLAANDIEIIVRFYYKVKHLSAEDHSMDNMVALDFVDNEWNIETGNANNWQTGSNQYTAGNYTIGLANKYYYNDNIGFLMLGSDGTLTLPSFNRKVKQIQVVGRHGASSSVTMNVFVGGTAVSTEVTGSTGTSIFDIDENYQDVGTNYTIKVTNNYNAQITAVIVVFEEEETSGVAATHPRANDLNPVAPRRDGSDLQSKATNNNK